MSIYVCTFLWGIVVLLLIIFPIICFQTLIIKYLQHKFLQQTCETGDENNSNKHVQQSNEQNLIFMDESTIHPSKLCKYTTFQKHLCFFNCMHFWEINSNNFRKQWMIYGEGELLLPIPLYIKIFAGCKLRKMTRVDHLIKTCRTSKSIWTTLDTNCPHLIILIFSLQTG